MSEKTQISITVDPEVAEYLSQDGLNRSGFMNKAAREKIGLDTRNTEMLRFRLNQVREEREEAEQKAERKSKLEEKLEKQLEQQQQQEEQETEELWQEAKAAITVEEIGGTPVITTKEEYVEQWAEKLDLSLDVFKDKIIARKEETDD